MIPLFIAGTDTDVGKTVVTSQLAFMAQKEGYPVTTQKWIQSGLSPDGETDLDVHNTHFQSPSMPERMPYVFSFPASPHFSAELAQQTIQDDCIFDSTNYLRNHGYWVLIEGSGGIMAPHRRNALMIDLIEDYQPRLIVVSANRLGTLNHTLLTVEALRHRGISIVAIILNDGAPNCEQTDRRIRDDNFTTLCQCLELPIYRLERDKNLPKEIVSTAFSACQK